MSEQKQTRQIRTYTAEDRRQAAALFASLGTFQAVADATGITRQTISGWQEDAEFIAALNECRRQLTQEHINVYQKIITKAQETVLDRLQYGDEVLTKDGSIARVAMKGKDAAVVMAIANDKAQILQNKPTSISATDDRLARIAERLEKAIGQRSKLVSVDGEIVDDTVNKI